MNGPVDVLAAMDAAIKGAEAPVRDGLIEARVAVAELIETSAAALQYMRLHRYADQAWADDLAAALARAQGGAA